MKLLPPHYLLAHLIAMGALHLFSPGPRWLFPPWTWLGLVPLAAGLVIGLWANHLFERNQTPVRPFEPVRVLVLAGPYRFSRNPMYLGMVLLLAGVATLLGTLTPVAIVVAFPLLMYAQFIRHEERALEAQLGEPFVAYKRRVRRWM